MYNFITGPLLWVTFAIFFVGLAVRVVLYIRGLDWRLDRVAYRAYPGLGIKGALSSIIHWLIPFGSHGWRAKPLYTIIFFVFPYRPGGHSPVPGRTCHYSKRALGPQLAHHSHGPGRCPDHRRHGHHDLYCHPAPWPCPRFAFSPPPMITFYS